MNELALLSSAEADGSLVPLGLDFLTFLATTVLVIPLFKSVKASPILGCALAPSRAPLCLRPLPRPQQCSAALTPLY